MQNKKANNECPRSIPSGAFIFIAEVTSIMKMQHTSKSHIGRVPHFCWHIYIHRLTHGAPKPLLTKTYIIISY